MTDAPFSLDEPVRVLHILGGLGAGGIETFLMSIYREIDRSKIQFDFLVYPGPKYFYEEEVQCLGGRVFRLQQNRKHPLRTYRAIKQFLSEHRYQNVHCHYGSLDNMMPLITAKACGIEKRIVHAHCTRFKVQNVRDFADITLHLLNRVTARRFATDAFACSAEAAKWFGFDGWEAWKYVPNGIDVTRFTFDGQKRSTARKSLGVSNADVLIGNTGRFSPQKNQLFLLDAFAMLHERIRNTKLVLIGSGPLEEQIRQKIESLELQSDVFILSNRRDTDSLYCAMDCFVFPSIYEGLGIALVEAETSGLPCVVSDAVPEEAIFSENAVVVPLSDSPEQWAQRIEWQLRKGRLEGAEDRARAAGFDMRSTAVWLQEYYLSDK